MLTLGQLGRLEPSSAASLWLHAVGAGTLAVLALHEAQWGFFVLEGIWATVAAVGLAARCARPHGSRARVATGAPVSR